ncbi:hypothetical protein H6P81_001070 [Aristolochia fimbriata]|uniref:Uncharacterized protein n=1 Tax=Aristolochia fimbriata TaxID=158543 RepID=A0AAV7F5Z8_ARIFI|nr:hypothetical protein H6P81_001070 [Aristolochia fimbriata]
MDGIVVESTPGTKTPSSYPLGAENFDTLLKESIDRFLHETKKQKRDFSGFRTIFLRLLQSRLDPPLEVVWFYSAISFHESRVSQDGASTSLSEVKDLFQLLCACSASSDGAKSIALLAPLIGMLHYSFTESSSGNHSSKKAMKMARELESLTEGIIGYISICCCKYGDEDGGSAGSLSCFSDLIKVWAMAEAGEALSGFFPLISDQIRDELGTDGCRIDYLSAIVILQAFFLRLCLKFQSDVSKSELQKELKIWAVGAITGFRNCLFFELLLRMLLEPKLPATFQVSPEDESMLRELLLEAVILVEYSFLNPETASEQSVDWMRSLAILRLIATHEAVHATRSKGDHDKAISYIDAFSRSRLPSDITNWVKDQTGMEESVRPDGCTPQSILKWLLNLEDQGMRLIANDILKIRSRLTFDDAKVAFKHPTSRIENMKMDEDLFYIDSKGVEQAEKSLEEEDQGVPSNDSEFLAAAQMMRSTATNGMRKRKETNKAGLQKKVKFLKYHIPADHVEEKMIVSDGDATSGSEVENPLSDEDMEESEE